MHQHVDIQYRMTTVRFLYAAVMSVLFCCMLLLAYCTSTDIVSKYGTQHMYAIVAMHSTYACASSSKPLDTGTSVIAVCTASSQFAYSSCKAPLLLLARSCTCAAAHDISSQMCMRFCYVDMRTPIVIHKRALLPQRTQL
jgi:hypothetical protein